MKKTLFAAITILAAIYCNAQVSVYVKLTPYPSSSLPALVDENPGTTHSGQILLTTISGSEFQAVNIGSQSGGAGSGKVRFDSIVFSKPVSINSSTLFLAMCTGNAFKFAEFSYYNAANQIIYRQTMSLVAVGSMARTAASCSTGCPGIVENISMKFGTQVFTFYTTPGNLATGVSRGWDAIRNIILNDPTYSAN